MPRMTGQPKLASGGQGEEHLHPRAFGPGPSVPGSQARERAGIRSRLRTADTPSSSTRVATRCLHDQENRSSQTRDVFPVWPTYRRSAAAASAKGELTGGDERARGNHHGREVGRFRSRRGAAVCCNGLLARHRERLRQPSGPTASSKAACILRRMSVRVSAIKPASAKSSASQDHQAIA
jgi:hypothetical protein